MANFFKEMARTGPHSLEEVRLSLDTDLADHKQFIPLLKEHHDFLEESISVLIDKEATDFQKQEHLERFFRLVEMHGKAEQEVLYNHLKANPEKEARLEGFAGQDEHDLAFQLEAELTGMGYKTQWTEEIAAKAKVVAGLVKNHIKEEESTMFLIAVENMTEEEMEDMRDAYIQKCIGYLINDRAETIFAGDWKMGTHTDTDSFHH
ncbi:MAG: hemerythrin domain-containing protein [Bacteriovorax sp.]|nr:hemerythrin domain-containing protein [Bacteriovorax sp.]